LKRPPFDGPLSPSVKRLRQKLVRGYTVAIVLVLACSVTASFSVLKHFLTDSLKESLFLILDAEISESIPALTAWKAGQKMASSPEHSGNFAKSPEAGANESEARLNDQVFTVAQFWFAADGTALMAESHLENKVSLLSSVRHWPYPGREIHAISAPSHDASATWHFIATADDVYQDGELLGKVVVAVNLRPFFRFTYLYYAVCFATIVVVSVLAFFVGTYFVLKAILPVENAMEKQRRFVEDASHELRTPLSILLASVDMLNGKHDNRLLARSMKEEILNMRSLTNSLLTLARFDREDIKRAPFDLSEVSRSAVRKMLVVANEKNIEIAPYVDDGIQAYGDEIKIGQLIGILIDNAIKYSPRNSVTRLDVTASRGVVRIAVTDHGKGIPEEHLEHIFDRFYRIDKARSRQTGGYGLGLSIAQTIVSLHEGKIQVESTEDSGSTFTVLLPLKYNGPRNSDQVLR
jgi:signal transduction histidine kinase